MKLSGASPGQKAEFERFLSAIEPKGGGENAENSLEAIACALKSDWTTKGVRKRCVTALFSNASYLPLGARSDCPGYPTDLPKSFEQLKEIWVGESREQSLAFRRHCGRLLLFVPDDDGWNRFAVWPRTGSKYSTSVECDDFDIFELVNMIFEDFL